MSAARLSTKGQLVIPSRFRRALHLQPGDTVAISLEGERLVLARAKSVRARLVKDRRGRKVLVAPADAPPMTTDVVKALLTDFP
ncbi:MAG TPA: AbrB/MazE/SpoVT family DNA-binding domain-containing protein [Candidatus Limnocylindria bacterium]|nr:AbrB/MazE/SpoVT family DNA-binding domain-containing protein [Candidatus Limnocylindria bacterium]